MKNNGRTFQFLGGVIFVIGVAIMLPGIAYQFGFDSIGKIGHDGFQYTFVAYSLVTFHEPDASYYFIGGPIGGLALATLGLYWLNKSRTIAWRYEELRKLDAKDKAERKERALRIAGILEGVLLSAIQRNIAASEPFPPGDRDQHVLETQLLPCHKPAGYSVFLNFNYDHVAETEDRSSWSSLGLLRIDVPERHHYMAIVVDETKEKRGYYGLWDLIGELGDCVANWRHPTATQMDAIRNGAKKAAEFAEAFNAE